MTCRHRSKSRSRSKDRHRSSHHHKHHKHSRRSPRGGRSRSRSPKRSEGKNTFFFQFDTNTNLFCFLPSRSQRLRRNGRNVYSRKIADDRVLERGSKSAAAYASTPDPGWFASSPSSQPTPHPGQSTGLWSLPSSPPNVRRI